MSSTLRDSRFYLSYDDSKDEIFQDKLLQIIIEKKANPVCVCGYEIDLRFRDGNARAMSFIAFCSIS